MNIFINPVHAHASDICEQLERAGHRIISAQFSLIDEYEKSFCEQAKSSAHLIDSRCPRALAQATAAAKTPLNISPNLPILIATAMRLQKELNEPLAVLAPCKSLADLGNAQGICGLEFFDAQGFKERFKITYKLRKLSASPVSLTLSNLRTLRLSQGGKISRYFAKSKQLRFDFVELLYCKNGCHNSSEL